MAFESIWLWMSFAVFILTMLALDLGIFHRNAHAISLREAALWSAIWIGLSLLFTKGEVDAPLTREWG